MCSSMFSLKLSVYSKYNIVHTAKIDGSENASNGRLQEFKNNGKLLIVRPTGDGRLPEVQTVRL